MTDAVTRAKEYVTKAALASLEGRLDDALKDLISASELYASAVKQAPNKQERQRILILFDECAQEAERIKARQKFGVQEELQASLAGLSVHTVGGPGSSTTTGCHEAQELREIPKKEQLLLLKSSSVDGLVFPLWNNESIARHMDGKELYQDTFSLLEKYKDSIDDYRRLPQIIEGATMSDVELKLYTSLSQRVINDCSLVASLIVASQWSFRQHGSLVTDNLYPQDARSRPMISTLGKYMMKIYLNGAYRQVMVDDYLPLDKDGSATSILTFSQQYLNVVWPAIVEKIFLKVVGHDFRGSDSASDLRLLTGWIPQEISLRMEGLDTKELSRDILQPWLQGLLLVTLGSGKLSCEEQADTGIVSEHNYAVVGIREERDQCILSIQNPWRPNADETPTAAPPKTTFEMDLMQARHHFTKLFLNWHPRRWLYKSTTHTVISLDQFSITDHNIYGCPQYSISNNSDTTASVFLLLERHRPLQPVVSSLAIFAGSERIVTSAAPLQRTDFYGSASTSIEFDIPAMTTRTIAHIQKGLQTSSAYATMTAYCHIPQITMAPMPAPSLRSQIFRDSWTPGAGSTTSTRYAHNPRYCLEAPSDTTIHVILETDDRIACHFALVYGHAPVLTLTHQNTRSTQGYATLYTSASMTLNRGEYSLVLSTLKPESAPYVLTVLSDSEISMDKAQPLGAGQNKNVLTSHWPHRQAVQRFSLTSARMNLVTIHIHAPAMANYVASLSRDGRPQKSVDGQGSLALDKVPIQRDGKYILTCQLRSGIAEGEFEVQVYSDGVLQLARC